jgi:hypothetical protein
MVEPAIVVERIPTVDDPDIRVIQMLRKPLSRYQDILHQFPLYQVASTTYSTVARRMRRWEAQGADTCAQKRIAPEPVTVIGVGSY